MSAHYSPTFRLMRQYRSVWTNYMPWPIPQSYRALFWKIYFYLPLRGAIFCLMANDQIDGVAMGSPLGPVLANIFMCSFEQNWVLNNNARPSIWFRYVDDTFTLFNNKDTALQFLQYLNSRHQNIKFTIEFEQNQEMPFLDVLVQCHPNNSFSTSIHRKKIFTELYTQWDSFTPRKYKVNLIPAPLHIGVFASVRHPVCYSLLWTISRSFFHVMGTPVVLLPTSGVFNRTVR